jgi:hypothetical protein
MNTRKIYAMLGALITGGIGLTLLSSASEAAAAGAIN